MLATAPSAPVSSIARHQQHADRQTQRRHRSGRAAAALRRRRTAVRRAVAVRVARAAVRVDRRARRRLLSADKLTIFCRSTFRTTRATPDMSLAGQKLIRASWTAARTDRERTETPLHRRDQRQTGGQHRHARTNHAAAPFANGRPLHAQGTGPPPPVQFHRSAQSTRAALGSHIQADSHP